MTDSVKSVLSFLFYPWLRQGKAMADAAEARVEPVEACPPSPEYNELHSLLRWLDRRLEQAVAEATAAYGRERATKTQRGMHIDLDAVERLLARKAGEPTFAGGKDEFESSLSKWVNPHSRLGWLQQTFELSAFDLQVVVIALAPELDRGYERLYAFLQDDVGCRRSSVDLALNLLCDSGRDKLERQCHFTPDAPLLRQGLLHLVLDGYQGNPTLLAHNLQLDEQIIRLLLGRKGLDSRLVGFCELVQPTVSLGELPLSAEVKQALSVLVVEDWQRQKPLRLYFQGADWASKRRTAEALAGAVQAGVLVVDLTRMVGNIADFDVNVKLLFREAWFQNALLYLEGWDVLLGDQSPRFYQSWQRAVAESRGITIVAGMEAWVSGGMRPIGMVTVPFAMPDFAQRRDCWHKQLEVAGGVGDGLDVEALADRFRLTFDQIAEAVATACNSARWLELRQRAKGKGQKEERGLGNNVNEQPITSIQNPSIQNSPPASQTRHGASLHASLLFAAARTQSGHELLALARKIEPRYGWNDIVLPTEQKTQLRDLCNHAKYRHIVLGEWGFEQRLALGKGLNVLFSGLPGTGKTMAAGVIAGELQLDLYQIDLSQVVSKYIGETEKNLNGIFTAAANSNAILLFDEADALFGKRTQVGDAHDRYANIEVGYLLQKMEEYEGVAILTTNVRSNMDEAFVRRLRFIVEFPFPDRQQRVRIWQGILPQRTPRQGDIDWEWFAERFELAGGNIRNVALAAAFLAAAQGGMVTRSHLLQGIRREYQKMGKVLMEEEFGVSGVGKS